VRRAGLIINPMAGKESGKGMALAAMLDRDPGVSVAVMARFEDIAAILKDFAAAGVSDLFISSGDGTVHEILTQLAEDGPFASLPRIGLLPHGTTNLAASDVGLKPRAIDDQARFIRRLAPAVLKPRPTVRCANPGDGRVRHGMFVGTGAVADATRYCQDAFNAKGVKGQWATFGTLASGVLRALFTKPDPSDPSRFDRPYDITVESEGREMVKGPQMFALATTLERLVLGTRPFWGGKSGPIRATAIAYPPPSVVRWLLPAMYGGEDRRMPQGCVSFCSDSLRMASKTAYVIDGEFFDGPAGEALRLETGPVITFVCG
jgi:diacylglycerol kinase (ATP)